MHGPGKGRSCRARLWPEAQQRRHRTPPRPAARLPPPPQVQWRLLRDIKGKSRTSAAAAAEAACPLAPIGQAVDVAVSSPCVHVAQSVCVA